ncbi:MAG TPA: class I SAM-dependent methyltransferase [Armatimonadota bacterium]|nr:class I SAM-dependent methyltransferase [Armatimonadota bacterium]
MYQSESTFDVLISDALKAPFSGWDFSYIHGRKESGEWPWSYGDIVRSAMLGIGSLLDMGTGGGEVFSGFAPFPPHTIATEGYPPNVPIARARLEPLGVSIVPVVDDLDVPLPFSDGEFDLVINRQEWFNPIEVARILTPGGRFITQQIGVGNESEIVEGLKGKPTEPDSDPWCLDYVVRQLLDAGLEVEDAREASTKSIYSDIGAIVYQVRACPWWVEDFTAEKYRDRLLAMHKHIEKHGGFESTETRLLVVARKPRR